MQERAGVRPMAERVGKSIHCTIPQAAREFLEGQLMVVVGPADADGRVWSSLPVGEPGFARVLDERTVRIDATPLPGDPLEEVLQEAGKKVGVLAIDLAILRRLRLSSKAERRPDGIYERSCQVYAKTAPSTARSVSYGPAEVGG